MPTRSYYFPKEFSHVEEILKASDPSLNDDAFRKFRELGIAPLFGSYDIAIVVGVGPRLVFSMVRRPHRHYRSFEIAKSDGSKRVINSPRTYLKVLQWWILDNILAKLKVSDQVFGFVRGRNIHDNAKFHLGSKHFLNVDIKAFFDTVTRDQVYQLFISLGYNDRVANTLSSLCTLNGVLPQGAPTSPSIGNQVLRLVDQKLHRLATRKSIKYSRYADDLTFSSREYIPSEFLHEVRSIVTAAGFSLKDSKTRFAGPGGRTEVTGLITREFVQPPVGWRKLHRAKLHALSRKPALEARDVAFLQGIKGYCLQYPDAVQMRALAVKAEELLPHNPAGRLQAPEDGP